MRAPHLKGSAKPAGAQHAVPLQRKKILEELLAGFGENGFGVELHAFDRERPVAPLKPAPDAVVLDTTHVSLDEQVARVVALARERLPG